MRREVSIAHHSPGIVDIISSVSSVGCGVQVVVYIVGVVYIVDCFAGVIGVVEVVGVEIVGVEVVGVGTVIIVIIVIIIIVVH